MTPEQIETARKLVAARRWEWKPGMRAALPHWERPDVFEYVRIDVPSDAPDSAIPDLTDDATGGTLLGLVRDWCAEQTEHVAAEFHIEGRLCSLTVYCQVLDEDRARAHGTIAHAAAQVLLEVKG